VSHCSSFNLLKGKTSQTKEATNTLGMNTIGGILSSGHVSFLCILTLRSEDNPVSDDEGRVYNVREQTPAVQLPTSDSSNSGRCSGDGDSLMLGSDVVGQAD
jgi:hypothetical protein